MTKFADKTFSVALGSEAYRDNWDAVFGEKPAVTKRDDGAYVVGPPPDGHGVGDEAKKPKEG